jgi:hypothetical protein
MAECPLLALSGHRLVRCTCLLLTLKRTLQRTMLLFFCSSGDSWYRAVPRAAPCGRSTARRPRCSRRTRTGKRQGRCCVSAASGSCVRGLSRGFAVPAVQPRSVVVAGMSAVEVRRPFIGMKVMSAFDPKRTFRLLHARAESSKEEPLIIPAPEGYVNAIGYEPALCLKSRLLSANPVTVSQTT